MDFTRRKFIQTIATAFGGVGLTGKLPLPAGEAAGSSGFVCGTLSGIGKLDTLEEAAFCFGNLAWYMGTSMEDALRVAGKLSLKKMPNPYTEGMWRQMLKKCRPEHVEQVLAHRKEACDLLIQDSKFLQSLPDSVEKLRTGMDKAVTLYQMPDKEFAKLCENWDREAAARFKESKSKPKKEADSPAPQQSVHELLRANADELLIRWDTIKHATTRRIKITARDTQEPGVLLAPLAAALRVEFPRDDFDFKRTEERIFIRNPSRALQEELTPHLLQKQESRSR